MSTATDLPAPVIPARHRRELEGVAGLLTRRATGSSDGGNGIAILVYFCLRPRPGRHRPGARHRG